MDTISCREKRQQAIATLQAHRSISGLPEWVCFVGFHLVKPFLAVAVLELRSGLCPEKILEGPQVV